jgi:hypothetical protein
VTGSNVDDADGSIRVTSEDFWPAARRPRDSRLICWRVSIDGDCSDLLPAPNCDGLLISSGLFHVRVDSLPAAIRLVDFMGFLNRKRFLLVKVTIFFKIQAHTSPSDLWAK